MTLRLRHQRKRIGLKMLQTVDLFSGIGGFSRGLEATGFFKTTRFVENDPYCQAVLRYHWPDIPVLGDIKNARRPDFPERTDLVCGGFPCQPFSQAGKQQAQDDPRHLWPEMFRIIRELRPTWVCGENVTGLIRLGLDEVLTDLENEGYATRTFNIPACATGAPHLRQRLWIIAHANSESEPDQPVDGGAGARQLGFEFVADADSGHEGGKLRSLACSYATEDRPEIKHKNQTIRSRHSGANVADPKSVHGEWPVQKRNSRGKPEKKAGDRSSLMADPKSNSKDGLSRKPDEEPDRRHTRLEPECGSNGQSGRRPGPTLADPDSTGLKQGHEEMARGSSKQLNGGGVQSRKDKSNKEPEDHWSFEPEVGRLVDGLPNRVPQLRALGNSIIPQIAERIGYAIALTSKGE